MSLTPKQKRMLDFILEYTEKNGYAPSQAEIAAQFGFNSLGTVQNYIVRLQRQGALQKTWNARRGVKVLPSEPSTSARLLPLVGRVAAGRPIEAIENRESIEVPKSLITSQAEHFVLRVKGDSMIEDGVLDNDLVIVRKQSQAENGQSVVALVNNEATLKKYFRKKGRIELHPANSNYKPIIVEEKDNVDFKIEGIMVGLIRKLH